MASPNCELECLRLLVTFASIKLLAAELRSRSGIRIIPPGHRACHVGQIQIDLVRLGEALQRSDLHVYHGGVSSAPVQHSDSVRSVSHPFCEVDGLQHSFFLLGHRQELAA